MAHADDPIREPSAGEHLAGLALAGGRIAIGAGIWLAPRPTLRALGFEDPGPQALTLARVAGSRDLVLGLMQVAAAADRGRLHSATIAAAACDAGDFLAFGLLLAGGETRAGIRGVAGAGPATVAGLALARSLRRAAP